ncbi:hypothetical protein IMG5_144630 [Ichthyophthirius multifiliis]|uniref:PLD phosphodiesterase domain-containing protein n=1 Tax=Ichthyophthirius multifiliis TaxID=5932 RepID=G0QXQ2_ICHMU|nr:hypothetical protein IMG5_144630 [Ichthyophthirius multifiliis]EGR29989.1 hypothetical protein IMG5_144630 [Ichthyophthirius multifiliis]|eukprot:XP_004031225.1 hypothetical protein IMG5_144630 [Ichthyophthirius multifiliis]
MTFFNIQFFKKQQEVNNKIKEQNKKFKPILFPHTQIIYKGIIQKKQHLQNLKNTYVIQNNISQKKGDQYFRTLWSYIDQAKTYAWLTTYAFNDSPTSNFTFKKLIQAQKRGVNVVLFVDDLQNNINKELIQQLIKAGGQFKSLNPTWSELYKNVSNQEFFRRHHEKLFIVDNFAIIDFQHILKWTWPPENRGIQDEIINQINHSKFRIKFIQPYYYPMKEFDDYLIKALQRGVEVEIITSQNRDQPAYQKLSNKNLMKNLTDEGCKVYEITDRLLHMKAYIIDDKYFTLGSLNNDRWSWRINNELNIFVQSEKETKKVYELYNHVKQQSNALFESKKEHGYLRLFKAKMWGLFLYLSECQMSKHLVLGNDGKWNIDIQEKNKNNDYWKRFQ